MKYGEEDQLGLKIERDFFGEHFSSDLHCNYMVFLDGECIGEDEDPRKLAERMNAIGSRLVAIARKLERAKVYNK